MDKELYYALEALCGMWEQYCKGEWGHMCMSAGEHTEEVLDKYNLLINRKGYAADIDHIQLEKYFIESHQNK